MGVDILGVLVTLQLRGTQNYHHHSSLNPVCQDLFTFSHVDFASFFVMIFAVLGMEVGPYVCEPSALSLSSTPSPAFCTLAQFMNKKRETQRGECARCSAALPALRRLINYKFKAMGGHIGSSRVA
jgi:hypothetical protein